MHLLQEKSTNSFYNIVNTYTIKMSTANGPPMQFYAAGQHVAPPNKKIRAAMTPGTDSVLNETDQAIARRRVELDRLKHLQKQHVPVMNNARDQLQGRGVLGSPPALPSPTRRQPPVLSTSNGPPVLHDNARNPNSGPISRRLDESFVTTPMNPSSRTGVVSPLASPTKQQTMTPPIVASVGFSPSTEKQMTFINPPLVGSNSPRNGVSSGTVSPSKHVGSPMRGPPPGPPTGPSPQADSTRAPINSQSQSKPKNSVSFGQVSEQSPPLKVFSPEIQSTTPLPVYSPETNKNMVASAGYTPFHANGNAPQLMMETPTNSVSSQDKPPLSTGRSEILSTMRSVADTPPSKSIEPFSASSYISINGNRDKKQVGFLTPVINGTTPRLDSLIASPLAISKRAPTPHPKLSRSINMEDEFLVESSEIVTFEYESDSAIFTVRRPYGKASETELWYSAGYLNSKMYAKNANVTKPETFEVVATIICDGSILALHGDVEVRHRQQGDSKWKEFGNIRENEFYLGSVTYIDKEANERQYSLDTICEGALAVREHYCSSMLSTGEAFRLRSDRRPNLQTLSLQSENSSPTKPPSNDASVGTDEVLHRNAEKTSTLSSSPASNEESAENSADVLSTAVGLFFSTIFGIIWFFVVRIPFLIITHVFVIFVAVLVLSILRLHVSEDNGASEIGAMVNIVFNRPGIL